MWGTYKGKGAHLETDGHENIAFALGRLVRFYSWIYELHQFIEDSLLVTD